MNERVKGLFSLSFWKDTLERVVRTFAAVLGGVLVAQQDWPTSDGWKAIFITTVVTLLMCLGAATRGEPGTASIQNPAPPNPPVEDDPEP